LQFSMGPTGSVEMQTQANGTTTISVGGFNVQVGPMEAPIQYNAADGLREITVFGTAFMLFQPVYAVRPLDVWQMFEEASTGYSGAVGRQVELNTRTTSGGALSQTDTLMSALELGDTRGVVNLRADGMRDTGSGFAAASFSYRTDGTYKSADDSISLTHAQ